MTTVAGVHTPTSEEQEEFDRRLKEATVEEQRVPMAKVNGRDVVWAPQAGSQTSFMSCSLFEALFHGTRGPGKTDGLLMAFAQHVGKGHGAAWRGIIFRETYPQLADVQAKSEKWFRQIFGNKARFNKSKMMWEWDTGEVLMFRHMKSPSDYWNYHGHEYPFIGWEELTNWINDECYRSMFACCRSSTKGIPRMVRATTNPYGPGHNWVKDRFRLHGRWDLTIIITDAKDVDGRSEPNRCAIHGHIDENKVLLAADPHYKQTIVAAATNPAMAEAWLDGSWDIVAGGMFEDVWNPKYNVVDRFAIPSSWKVDRSFDWGSSAPFSVGWWAESDGSDLRFNDGRIISTVRGDLFRIKEWYGWNGQANQGLRMLAVDIAKGIIERELLWKYRRDDQTFVKPGPADSSIFDVENGVSIGNDMAKPIRFNGKMYKGIPWGRADKRPGSRKTGWEAVRKMMAAAHPNEGNIPREKPGLFVVGVECPQFLRTVPSLPRDEKDLDDVLTTSEDHCGDEVRYRVRFVGTAATTTKHTGMY
ncbi:terminase family protein [Candidatus Pacearchaeota archaeon]|nr:terminase family protein [Candidatus Pacearchaeota archaeon]